MLNYKFGRIDSRLYNNPLFRRHLLPHGEKHQANATKHGIVITDNTNIASIIYFY